MPEATLSEIKFDIGFDEEIEYVGAIGEIEPNLQKSMQLYCHRLKMFVTVKDIITKAKKHGYEGLG